MSLGFEVSVSIPYSVFRNIDKKEADIVNVSAFINDIAKSFKSLLAPAKVITFYGCIGFWPPVNSSIGRFNMNIAQLSERDFRWVRQFTFVHLDLKQ